MLLGRTRILPCSWVNSSGCQPMRMEQSVMQMWYPNSPTRDWELQVGLIMCIMHMMNLCWQAILAMLVVVSISMVVSQNPKAMHMSPSITSPMHHHAFTGAPEYIRCWWCEWTQQIMALESSQECQRTLQWPWGRVSLYHNMYQAGYGCTHAGYWY